jgi:hypothetical protein
MGQYYTALVIDGDSNIKTLKPHQFDNGAKLLEHSWIGNSFVNAVYTLIYNSPCKVAWIGDYSNHPYEPNNDAYAKALSRSKFTELYKIVWEDNEGDSLHPKDFTEEQLSLMTVLTSGMYLINHSRNCYLELGTYIRHAIDKDTRCINPLPLLTACGNGRGGGDFHEGNIGYESVGIWAFDELEYSNKKPQGYTEAHFRFMEG